MTAPSDDRPDTTTVLSTEFSAALAGRYVLERALERGGMSRVIVAREIALGREDFAADEKRPYFTSACVRTSIR